MEDDNATKTIPNTFSRYPLAILAVGLLLYFGKVLFIPMFFGLLIALVMYPICSGLEKRKLARSLAIAVCLAIVTFLFAALVWLSVVEIDTFSKDIPRISSKLQSTIPQLQEFVHKRLFISVEIQTDWLNNIWANTRGNIGSYMVNTVNYATSTFFILFMSPVFAALFLYHRGTFVAFLRIVVPARYRGRISNILHQVIHTYFNYIKGMIMVYIIVGLLNSAGLFALGIKHALLFGMLTAIMTIIPYLGIIISAMLPISVALITKESLWYPLGVVAVFTIVQYLEANIIFPKVVGTELDLSTWATLVAIIAGGILWGVAGMILFIPFAAILKIISDNIEPLKPLNILLNRKKGYSRHSVKRAVSHVSDVR